LRLVVGGGLEWQLTQDRAARVAASGTTGRVKLGTDGTTRRRRSASRIAAAVASRAMKLRTILLVAVALALAGCGSSDDADGGPTAAAPATTTASTNTEGRQLPPGAVEPAEPGEHEAGGPGAGEASPEAAPEGPSATGDLPADDRAAVAKLVSDYIAGLDHRRAARVCALLVPGSLDLAELPKQRAGCTSSMRASIGTRPRSGGPAWRRTELVEIEAQTVGDDRARVTATVTHRFSDRKYVSVEDDVIYLERVRGRWLLAKPSATLYRAVGYPEPPLRAFSPPAGW
jgi:hypothetical protein